MSQFAFLTPEFPDVFKHAKRAEELTQADPRSACFHTRLALETAVNWIYARDGSVREPYERTLAARIYEPAFQRLLGQGLVAKARIVKDFGNEAVHEVRDIPVQNAITALRELFHIAYWFTRTYARGQKPNADLAFSPEALPRTAQIATASLAQLKESEKNFVDAMQALDASERLRLKSDTERTKLEAEIQALRAEIEAVKRANEAVADTHDYDEATTRVAFIDLLLREAGWSIDRPGKDIEFPVTGMPNRTGEGYVDYVLWADDGKPLALVEAKRTQRDARAGQQQGKLYADCLEARFGQRPVIFYSNGYEHWLWNDAHEAPRRVLGFLSKDELMLVIQRRAARKTLAREEIDLTIVERAYQHRAIRRITEAFENDHLRKALLVMATGAGKTRTIIALSDLLMRANWVKRVLFLADRNALVNQAINAFKKFLPSSSPVNLVSEKSAQGRVYISTYQTMMGLINESSEKERRFGVGHFDLIIIDEAHRSVYSKYKKIFEYFDSLLIGLTATPKDEIDFNTYRLFDLQRGVPTDVYTLEDAVHEQYLVPYQAVSVPTRFMHDGITYNELSEEEKEQWDATEWDEDGSVPERVDPPELNKWIFNSDTVDKVLEHLMTHGQKVAAGDRLGKTIIFAKNHAHAQFIVERFDANYPHLKGSFARVIDNTVEYAQSLIDDFSQAQKPPHIAVSVDMLDTGIDVPEVVNLVFFKAVRSKTKFWQMVGRGTRLCPDLFGPEEDKKFFYIFDFCRNFEFFNQNPQLSEGSIAEPLSKRLFSSRVELIGELYDIHARGNGSTSLQTLRDDTTQALRREIDGMELNNFIVRPKRRFVEKYAQPEPWSEPNLDVRTELIDEVAGLPSSVADEDVDAKQFDLLIYRTQLSLLRADTSFKALRKKITETASLLEGLSVIPMIAEQLALIQEIQTEEYWQDLDVPMLETARKRLRSLIKLIEHKKRTLVYTDFEDEIGPATQIKIMGLSSVGTNMERFRAKARQFLKAHDSHIAIFKLHRNEPLTPTDLRELERIFAESGVGAPEEIERIRREQGLGLFVRSLVGLDRAAAAQAFNAFTSGRALSADQIHFVGELIEHLTARGVVEPALLYQSPFTDIHPLGVAGLFQQSDVTKLVGILEDVRRRAVA